MLDLFIYFPLPGLIFGLVTVGFFSGAIKPGYVRRALNNHPSRDPEWQACLDAAWVEIEEIERRQGL